MYKRRHAANNRLYYKEQKQRYILEHGSPSDVWQKRNPEKKAAHDAVYHALKTGKLVKEPCFCGETEVEAHHEDYSKPLEVIWCCRRHHADIHVEMRAEEVIDA